MIYTDMCNDVYMYIYIYISSSTHTAFQVTEECYYHPIFMRDHPSQHLLRWFRKTPWRLQLCLQNMVNLVSTTLYLALHIAFLYVEIELQMPAHVHVKSSCTRVGTRGSRIYSLGLAVLLLFDAPYARGLGYVIVICHPLTILDLTQTQQTKLRVSSQHQPTFSVLETIDEGFSDNFWVHQNPTVDDCYDPHDSGSK